MRHASQVSLERVACSQCGALVSENRLSIHQAKNCPKTEGSRAWLAERRKEAAQKVEKKRPSAGARKRQKKTKKRTPKEQQLPKVTFVQGGLPGLGKRH